MARPFRIQEDPMLLEAALEGLESKKRQIEDQIQQVKQLLGSGGVKRRGRPPAKREAAVVAAPGGRRELSAEARKKIAAGQKKRWAEFRKKQQHQATK